MTVDDTYFKRVAEAARQSARSLLGDWFPDGVWTSPGMFQVGSIDGGRGQSLRVWVFDGAWKDFNPSRAPSSGGDLISLRAGQLNVSQKVAADEIAAALGVEAGSVSPPASAARPADRERRADTDVSRSVEDVYAAYVPIVPPPAEAPLFAAGQMSPPIFNPKQAGDPKRARGQFAPSSVHPYYTAAGDLIGYVLRRDFQRKGKPTKETPFVMWCRKPDGAEQWCRRRPSDGGGGKLPIYGLARLAKYPEKPVLVVEGEKACDAGRRLAGEQYVVVGWPGGGAGARNTDWSPLAGRDVTLWPDADRQVWPAAHELAGQVKPPEEQPGRKTMLEVARRAMAEDAGPVRIVDIDFGDDAVLSVDGWDLADGEAAGWTGDHVAAAISARARDYDPGAFEDEPGDGGRGGGEDAGDPAADCPFAPVGHRAGTYYVLSPAGELRDIAYSRMNANGLESLTDGSMAWYYRHFADFDERRREDVLSVVKARRWIMRACQKKGLFDPATPIRGRGVWNVDNAPMVHVGDAVWTKKGGWQPAGFVGAGGIYAAQPKIPRPAATPATADEAAGLMQRIAERWNFVEPWGADMAIGFLAQSYLGQAADWRAHMYCLAALGSGKSWLTGAITAALGGAANPSANNYTEAGLRQSLNGEARAILLDEAEPGDTTGHRIKAVIELIRHMSGLEGASVQRGSADGRAQSFHMTGAVWMASILQGRLAPQDRSRITTIHLGELTGAQKGPGGREATVELTADLRAASPALWARAIGGWPRFLENLAAWRSALDRSGCSPRQIDQVATLLAARDMMVSDRATDPSALSDEIDLLTPMLEEGAEETSGSVEGEECWYHLLTSQSGLNRDGSQPTVARQILRAMEVNGANARQQIQSLGLRYIHLRMKDREGVERDYGWGIVVANQHEGVRRLFRGTRWGDDAWPGALGQLTGHVKTKTVRIDGIPSKGIFVPKDYLPALAPGERDHPDDPGPDGGADDGQYGGETDL
tara:strand:+ start:2041 stop:5007 length:2967 start_codon:yes stop_codon:yes gene_type:complete